ncbi:MAG: acyl-CoA/acyl-ACP dehydrogenase [Candidatus Helarchaeota archaeon]|nr:acyl-CoA/acyl-ACP dehydrogenase [Candidatus Helarchaeota archaeon]
MPIGFDTQGIADDILEKLSLENRYKFLNMNLPTIVNDKQMEFLKEAQKFAVEYEKKNKIDHTEEIYTYFPAFGEKGYLCRFQDFAEADIGFEDWGLQIEMMRYLAVDMFDPSFSMSIGATTLSINPCHYHHEQRPEVLDVLKGLVTGTKIGCILITEPERGSDAVHQLTTCTAQNDGSYLLNGTKIYNTNAPKATNAVAYASAEVEKGETMGQFLIDTKWDGWNCERIGIPWVPRLWLGKEELKDLRIPKEYVLGPPGQGLSNMFEGLALERIGIAFENLGQAWGALSHATLYANMRVQFGKPIIRFQGVGFTLANLYSQVICITMALQKFSESYDEKNEKYEHNIPKALRGAFEINASQLKYSAAKLSERVCYECANLMGGAGVNDNTLMRDLLGVSRIQEIVGGARQIQELIISRALGKIYKQI